MDDEEPLLRAEGVKKYFTTETGIFEKLIGTTTHVKAVDGVDLHIDRHETLGVVGESGCGKTTLGRVLSRLYDPTDGKIIFDGQDITDWSGNRLKELRKDIQVIFQDPMSSLNPRKTAGEIVGKPMKVHDLVDSQSEMRERVEELFEEVGLQRTHLDRYPHEFSGGQRQRVGIARALAVEPKLIIADEPVSALDVSVQAQTINLMKRLQSEYGLSYIFIAHDLSVVKHISDRVAVMYLGKLVEKGPTDAIYSQPQHPYTRALIHSIPNIEGKVGQRRKKILDGNPPSPIDPPTGCPFHTRCPEFIGDECIQQEPELESITESSGTTEPTMTGPTSSEGFNEPSVEGEHVAACHWLDRSSKERREQDPFRLINTEENE